VLASSVGALGAPPRSHGASPSRTAHHRSRFSRILALQYSCATRRNDVTGGKPHHLYRQVMSRWAVAPEGCKPEVKELALKGTREARCKRPRCGAWLRKHMVSNRSDKRPTGNRAPASISTMGQRPHRMVSLVPNGDRGWLPYPTSPKVVRGQPELPSDRSESREERIGSEVSHHLGASAEYIVVNVGGSDLDAKVSSSPMICQSVGGAVVCAW
jgi:hypothetical protein